MVILRTKEIRKLDTKELDKRIEDLKLELSKERANAHIGASVSSPGRIKEIKKTIARILTIKNQQSKGLTHHLSTFKSKTKEVKTKEPKGLSKMLPYGAYEGGK